MGNRGFKARQRAPGSVSFVQERKESYYLYLYATKQLSDNENVHHRQPQKGYRYHTQRNLTRGVDGRTELGHSLFACTYYICNTSYLFGQITDENHEYSIGPGQQLVRPGYGMAYVRTVRTGSPSNTQEKTHTH